MENNIIKVQLASTAGLAMRIESNNKNTIKQQGPSFDQALVEASSNNVWNKDSKEGFSLPVASVPNINNMKYAYLSQNNEGLPANAHAFQSIVSQASVQYGLPQSLINAVIKAESGFNADATSSAGAKGLMQLMDGTAKGLGVLNSYDPEQNINGGSKYLSMLVKKYDGELKAALAAYNAGPTRVDRTGIQTDVDFESLKSALPKETQRYVEKVISYIM